MSASLPPAPVMTGRITSGDFGPAPPQMGGQVRYLPPMPQISTVHRSTQPCMYEHRIGKGPGFWKWNCTRSGRPGVKKCNLVRVEQNQSTLVPINCMQEYVNVTKGYDVERFEETDPKTGQKIVRQVITPDVAVLGNVRRMGPAGPGVPVRMTAAQEEELKSRREAMGPYGQLVTEGETIMFGGRGAGQYGQINQRAAGQASQTGGQIRLPSRSAMRAKEVQFGPEDIQNFELGSLPGVIREPEQFQGLAKIGDKEIAFYAQDDSYGTTSIRHFTYGFTFSFRHLPYAYMTQQRYLEWLVSLSIRLRHEWPQFHNHVYDPIKDTIATVESYIMVTLGRLEAANKFFSRRELFAGAGEFRMVMHPVLAAYAFRPPQRTWYSPLSARWLEGAEGPELEAIRNVNVFTQQVMLLMAAEPLSVTESVTVTDADSRIMAIAEDMAMALLARLQFMYGYVVNTNFETVKGAVIGDIGLLSMGPDGQRRFLTKEFARYLEMFQIYDAGAGGLHYLPALRLRQAKEQGLVIPTMPIPPVAATGVPLPMSVPQEAPKPDIYLRQVNPPEYTYIGPGAAVVVPVGSLGGNSQQPQQAPRRR